MTVDHPDLRGKVAVVTGAGRGMGARRFIGRGNAFIHRAMQILPRCFVLQLRGILAAWYIGLAEIIGCTFREHTEHFGNVFIVHHADYKVQMLVGNSSNVFQHFFHTIGVVAGIAYGKRMCVQGLPAPL